MSLCDSKSSIIDDYDVDVVMTVFVDTYTRNSTCVYNHVLCDFIANVYKITPVQTLNIARLMYM